MKLLGLMTTILAATACHPSPRPDVQAKPGPTAELAGRRAQMLGWLHDYTETGQFPTDSAGMIQSVFVDDKGVRCPMAELIYRSGHADLVQAVAKEHDAVRLAAVTEGPLHDWMLTSGLTTSEIDLIQGAADINYGWMIQEGPSQQTILARGEMRGRLESAEKALRNGTAQSLPVAVQALPNGKIVKVAAVTLTTKVVPAAALTSGPRGTPVATVTPTTIELVQRRAASMDFVVSPNGAPLVVHN